MALGALVWKLASPYDAYVAHVARLNLALSRLRDAATEAEGHDAGLRSSVRLVAGEEAAGARLARFRERLGKAAEEMSDAQFEEFLAMLGNGDAALVEADRARAVSRLQHTTRGLEEYFAIAGHELAILENRDYNPSRSDISRQLAANRLPQNTTAEFAHELHQIAGRVGKHSS
jgi:hypothetical protein